MSKTTFYVYVVNRGRISFLGNVEAANDYAAKLHAKDNFKVDPDLLKVFQTPLPDDLLSPLLEGLEPPLPNKDEPTSETKKAKLLDKARKLLALSKSPNEHEAASAAEKMQTLIAEYNLDMRDVMNEPGHVGNRPVVIDKSILTPSNPWRRRLANAVSSLYFCKYYYEPHPKGNLHCFVGLEVNVAVSKMMFQYLLTTVNRLAQEGSKAYPKDEQSPYRVTFREACTSRLCTRIHERLEAAKQGGVIKTESGTTLPALLSMYEQEKKRNEEHIEQEVGPLRNVKTRVFLGHGSGYRDGRAAGDRISLDTQVGSETRRRIR